MHRVLNTTLQHTYTLYTSHFICDVSEALWTADVESVNPQPQELFSFSNFLKKKR